MSKTVKASKIFKLAQAEFCIQNRKYQDKESEPREDKCKGCIHYDSLCSITFRQIRLMMQIERNEVNET